MSASMAEGIFALLTEHGAWRYTHGAGTAIVCSGCGAPVGNVIAHQAAALAANGYGKLEPTQFVLAEREAELLNLKGPCRAPGCRLHFAHRGPCDTRRPE